MPACDHPGFAPQARLEQLFRIDLDWLHIQQQGAIAAIRRTVRGEFDNLRVKTHSVPSNRCGSGSLLTDPQLLHLVQQGFVVHIQQHRRLFPIPLARVESG
jgi:hypothetical protein